MAIVNKFTATLPNPTATHVDGFVFLLSTQWFIDAANASGAVGSPIDGGSKSLANGGGDMQAYADAATTTQLPLHVVEFVTGGSPAAQVWVRRESWTAGDTITIAKDDVQTVQPLPGSTYGQYNVYTADLVSHCEDLTLLTDAAGNNTFANYGTPAYQQSGKIGYGVGFVNSGVNSWLANTTFTEYTYSFWANIDNVTDWGSFLRGGSSFQIGRYSNADRVRVSHSGGSADLTDFMLSVLYGEWAHYAFVWDGSNVHGYVNGVLITSAPLTAAPAPSNTRFFYENTSINVDATVDELELDAKALTASKILDKYANQNDPDNFATIGPWVDAGAPTTPKPWWLFQEEYQ